MKITICRRGCYRYEQVGIHRAGCRDLSRERYENEANFEHVDLANGDAAAQYVQDNADDDGDGPIQTVGDCKIYPCCTKGGRE